MVLVHPLDYQLIMLTSALIGHGVVVETLHKEINETKKQIRYQTTEHPEIVRVQLLHGCRANFNSVQKMALFLSKVAAAKLGPEAELIKELFGNVARHPTETPSQALNRFFSDMSIIIIVVCWYLNLESAKRLLSTNTSNVYVILAKPLSLH